MDEAQEEEEEVVVVHSRYWRKFLLLVFPAQKLKFRNNWNKDEKKKRKHHVNLKANLT